MQNLDNQTILITGTAGFIGSNLTKEIIHTASNVTVIGLDSVNDYYDVSLKEYRLNEIENLAKEKSGCNWKFIKGNLADKLLIDTIFSEYTPKIVVNLAAQAGVRYSITNPDA